MHRCKSVDCNELIMDDLRDFCLVCTNVKQLTEANENNNQEPYNKYFKDVSKLNKIDIYRLLEIFNVTDHAIGHAVKKLLLCGIRTGGKTPIQEITEARDTLSRWLEMRKEDSNTQ